MNMLAVAVAAAATTLLVPTIAFVSHPQPVVAVRPALNSTDFIVGDGDFNQVRTEHPTDPATERRNHTLRLQYIESMLRNRDVSDLPAELRAERARNLDRLHDYWVRAEYPVNYQHPKAWEPCFIDKKGAICAVGFLVEQSAGRPLAEKINSRYQYATIKQIDAPELATWIAQSGLTKAEVVTIQGPAIEEMPVITEKQLNRSARRRARARARLAADTTMMVVTQAPVDEPVAVEEPAMIQDRTVNAAVLSNTLINTISVDKEPAVEQAPDVTTPSAVSVAPAPQPVAAPAQPVAGDTNASSSTIE
jgi:hypothetical protein